VCDANGDELTSANLPGDSFRTHHTNCEVALLMVGRAGGISCDTEVTAMFTPAVPDRHQAALKKGARGYIPDIVAHMPSDERGTVTRKRLCEVKTQHCNPSRYPVRVGARQTKSVQIRADALPAQYDKKLRKADERWCGVQADAEPEIIGPMRTILRSHGRLRGMVFGCMAEVSKDVDTLIKSASHTSARAAGLDLGSKDYMTMVGKMRWQARRKLACAVWKSIADLLLDRVQAVAGGTGASGSRWAREDAAGATPQATAREANQASFRRSFAQRDSEYSGAFDPH
jgi:hypothetical protein